MKTIEIIKDYIDLLEKNLGYNIIIYDECRLLENTNIQALTQFRKWHTNPYCLKIKENKELHSKCVHLKKDFINKVLKGSGVTKSTCFGGVTEYVLPIKYKDTLICMVSATEFEGQLHNSTYKALSKRVKLSYSKFISLRKQSLKKIEDEETIVKSINVLHHLLSKYILNDTEIPDLIDNINRNTNSYIIKAKEYIAQNFTKPIDVKSVAMHCHLSESRIKHLFSKTVGHGISEEIRICRLNYAKELLCTTEYSVKYISFISGFPSSDYFSTIFKSNFKISPLKYRQLKKRAYSV